MVRNARAKSASPLGGSRAGSPKATDEEPTRTVRRLGAPSRTGASMREHPVPHECAWVFPRSSSNRSLSVARGASARSAATSTGPPGFAAMPTSRLPSCLASASTEGLEVSGNEKDRVGEPEVLSLTEGVVPFPLPPCTRSTATPMPATMASALTESEIQATRLTPRIVQELD